MWIEIRLYLYIFYYLLFIKLHKKYYLLFIKNINIKYEYTPNKLSLYYILLN